MCGCSGMASGLISLLSPVLTTEISDVFHVHDNFNELKQNFRQLEQRLEQRNILDRDTIEDKSLRRFYYEVEDLINDTNCVINELDPHNQHTDRAYKALHPCGNFIGCIRNIKLPRQIGEKLRTLEVMINRLESQTGMSINNQVSREMNVSFDFKQVESKSNQIESIIKDLINGKANSKGVSIIGLRGMGKRVLAEYILNQSAVKAHFPLILKASFPDKTFEPDLTLKIFWVDVNLVRQDLDHQITPQFLKQTTHKWLLWMDDLPKILERKWQDFETKMRGTFLFTTINPNVATTTKTSSHYMGPLSDICCQHLATNYMQSPAISGYILNKCYGLLLIAESFTNSSSTAYREFKDGTSFWDIKVIKQELLPYLVSSFQGLEGTTLKCFHYLSLFPQEHQFDKEELILLWIGAGLLEATGEQVSSFLQKGNNIFNDLLENSVLQPLPTNEGLKYHMYKFSHFFAQYVAPKIYLSLSESFTMGALNDSDLCHLSVAQNIQQPDHQEVIKVRQGLRTFISICDGRQHGRLKEIQADLFSQMIALRVLVLKNIDIVDVPYLKHLKRLRLLDISDTLVQRLPEDLCSLSSLQILKFKKSRTDKVVVQLPDDFSKMDSLVFVDWDVIGMKNLLTNQPHNIGRLVYLETLPLFVVTNNKGQHITELQKMNRLQNSLRITNLEAVPNQQDAKKACIGEKRYLQSLELQWTTFPKGTIAKDVFSGLQPCNELKELHVVNYRLDSYPTWFGESSFLLQRIHLINCSSCNLLQSFGKLSALEVLHLERMHVSMDKLFHRNPNDNKQYFKALKSLILSSMELEYDGDWNNLQANDMPQLQKLDIQGSQNLATLPPLENHKELKHIEIEGCKKLPNLPSLPLSVESLIIKGSNELGNWCQKQIPTWQQSGHTFKLEFDSTLIQLQTTATSKTESSPSQQSFGKLSALEVLHLERMHVSMDKLFHRNPNDNKRQYFDALKSLILFSSMELEYDGEWNNLQANDIPELHKLDIQGSQNLPTLPPLQNHKKLKHIEKEGCKKVSNLPFSPLSVESLIMKGSSQLGTWCQEQIPIWLQSGHTFKLEFDSTLIQLQTSATSKTESSPSQQASEQQHNTSALKDQKVTAASKPATSGIVIQENGGQSKDNINGRNAPKIPYHEKGKAKMED